VLPKRTPPRGSPPTGSTTGSRLDKSRRGVYNVWWDESPVGFGLPPLPTCRRFKPTHGPRAEDLMEPQPKPATAKQISLLRKLAQQDKSGRTFVMPEDSADASRQIGVYLGKTRRPRRYPNDAGEASRTRGYQYNLTNARWNPYH
jgi:hypothetical protein